MTKQSRLFLVMFALTGGTVFALARAQQPTYAAIAGIAGLLLHWMLSAGNDSDVEVPDASYFLGFLLTLVLLAAGLWSLAGAGVATAARASGAMLYQFLYDLGAGLTITIAGLAIRQVRTLSATRILAAAQTSSIGSTSPLEPIMRELIDAVNRLPENIHNHEPSDPAMRAVRSTEHLEHALAESAPRIIASMGRLEDSIMSTAATLTRTGSALGDALTQSSERANAQIADVLEQLAKERLAMLAQFEEWRKSVAAAHGLLVDGHATLDSEYRRGLLAVSAAGRSFSQLSNQVAADIQRLPNPTERLDNLWTGVEKLDQRLRTSLGDASARLDALGAQAQATGASVDRLAQGLREASVKIERGGGDLMGTLDRELRDLRKVLDEFTELLEHRIHTIGIG
jgi:hypothetical protein